MADRAAASSSFIWPPVIYASAAIVAGGLAWFVPWTFVPAGFGFAAIATGFALIALGIGVAVSAERRFHAAGTPVPPTKPTKAIVTTGIYRRTRNPMYLGMSLVLIGLGFTFDQLWFLIALPVAVLAVTKLAIEREEAYLAAKFGAEYVTYKGQVRRWF